jgi:hypothetical protein
MNKIKNHIQNIDTKQTLDSWKVLLIPKEENERKLRNKNLKLFPTKRRKNND